MTSNNPNREADQKAILAHIDSVFKAFVNRDRSVLVKTHLDDFSGFTVRSRSTITSRDQYMQEIDGLLNFQHWKFYEITDFQITFHDQTAIVVYIARISGKDPQERYFETRLRVMDIYVNSTEGWNLAASSVSLHPDAIDSQLNAAISSLTMKG
jgi:ketosteroid isomerase-like protein